MTVAVIVMCAASSVSAQEMTDEDIAKLRELFKQGRDHYNRKEYEKSNKSYEEVLERLPKADLDINTAMVLFNIGGNYALLGQKEKAFESLEKAVSRGFWDADALENAPDLASLRGADGFELARLAERAVRMRSTPRGERDRGDGDPREHHLPSRRTKRFPRHGAHYSARAAEVTKVFYRQMRRRDST